MSHVFWVTVTVALVTSHGAQAHDPVAGNGGQSRSAELCEAFPWDVPVDRSFTAESVLRWRRGENDARPPRNFGQASGR